VIYLHLGTIFTNWGFTHFIFFSSHEMKFTITYKKQPKTLELFSTHLILAGIQVNYTEILKQEVNLPKEGGGGRVLLKLISDIEPKPFTIEFAELTDRKEVQDFIATKLSTNTKKTNVKVDDHQTIIKAKTNLLNSDPQLMQLHAELVIGQILTEDEFWSTRINELENQLFLLKQIKATSSISLLSLLPDSTVEGSDIKYTLTPEIIHAIFVQYPGVYKAYQFNVPDKVKSNNVLSYLKKNFGPHIFLANISIEIAIPTRAKMTFSKNT
jgi:hypothetical protein